MTHSLNHSVAPASAPKTNLADLHQVFARACASGVLGERARTTISNYRATFTSLQRITGASHVSDLTPACLHGFFRYGETQLGWLPSTRASHRKNLSPFIRWCVSLGHLSDNPLVHVAKPHVPRRLPDFYGKDEVLHLLRTISQTSRSAFERVRDRAIFGVLCLAGLRRGELLALRVGDVNLTERSIHVRAETAKNRQPRAVSVTSSLHELLTAYQQARTLRQAPTSLYWLSSLRPTGFTLAGLDHLLTRLSRKVGFRVKPHKMRHTFATRTYQGSRDIVAIQAALGHSDIKTTMIYTHALPSITQASLEKNPFGDIFRNS